MTPAALAATHLSAFGADKAWTADAFATFLDDPATILTGDANSFVLGRVTLDEAEILTLATAAPHQRQGLARNAMAEFVQRATASGATSIFLEVAKDNAPARAFYASAGFETVGARKNYYKRASGPAVDALILRSKITLQITPDS